MLISYLEVAWNSHVLISKVYSHFYLQFWVICWYLHICFTFHVLSGCHRNDGPLNHSSVAFPFVVLIPLELSSFGFSLVLTQNHWTTWKFSWIISTLFATKILNCLSVFFYMSVLLCYHSNTSFLGLGIKAISSTLVKSSLTVLQQLVPVWAYLCISVVQPLIYPLLSCNEPYPSHQQTSDS